MSTRSQARLRNLSRRALYALEAAKRVSDNVLKGRSVKDAIGSEKVYFQAHKTRSKEALKVATRLDAYVKEHGRIASWRHGPLTPTDRAHHVKADGLNFDVLAGPPKETGSYPGEEPNCNCEFGRAIEGAKLLK